MYHSPDALLQIEVYPKGEGIGWTGSLSWGINHEQFRDAPTLPNVLSELWEKVDRNHHIFLLPVDALRRPHGYKDHEWIDEATADVLHRLIHTTQMVFGTDWRILMVYQATENPELRVQMRLFGANMSRHAGGRGSSLLDAARELFRHAAPVFKAHLDFRGKA